MPDELRSLNIGGGGMHFCPGGYVPTHPQTVPPCSISTVGTHLVCFFFASMRSLSFHRICVLHGIIVGQSVFVVVCTCTDLGATTFALSFGNLFRESMFGAYLFSAMCCACCVALGLSFSRLICKFGWRQHLLKIVPACR